MMFFLSIVVIDTVVMYLNVSLAHETYTDPPTAKPESNLGSFQNP